MFIASIYTGTVDASKNEQFQINGDYIFRTYQFFLNGRWSSWAEEATVACYYKIK